MKPRTVEFDLDGEIARALAVAVKAYALAAYPPGGSECSQVARDALLDVAADCEAHRGGPLPVRRRIVPQLRAAVRWCLSQDGPADVQFRPGLETILTPETKSTC